MKYAVMLATVAALAASPAFAGGKGKGSLIVGSVLPVTTTVGNVSALNNTKVSALNNISVLSGNKTSVKAPVKVAKIGVLSSILAHGCGCN